MALFGRNARSGKVENEGRLGDRREISQNTHFVMESCDSYSLIDLVHKVHHNYFIKYNLTTLVLQPDVSCRGWYCFLTCIIP